MNSRPGLSFAAALCLSWGCQSTVTGSGLICGEGTHEDDGECVPSSNDTAGTDTADTGESPPDPTDADGDGFSEAEGDCDDSDADIHPNGTDGLIADRDCDGVAAEGTLDLAEYTFIGESPDDYAGYWVSTAGDVDGDGLDDVLVGAYDDDDMGPSAGAGYLILGSSLDPHGSFDLSEADYKIVGEDAGDFAGFVVETAGDLDGDSLADILVGAYGVGDRGPITGAVYVILGSSIGAPGTIYLSDADYKIVGESEQDFAGYALSSAGDVDGDGLDDILVGASGQDAGGNFAGAAYVILASSLAEGAPTDLSQADYKFIGETKLDWAGYSVSGAGDVDGDGLADLLIGADGDDGGWMAHASYLILGSSLRSNSTMDLSEADYKFIGEDSYDYASQVSTAGDVDGDGLDDIVVGAAGYDHGGNDAGAAYVILASSLGARGTIDISTADYVLFGERSGDLAGSTVANAGDVDGDGLSDILVGALRHDSAYDLQGAAYVVLGRSLSKSREMDLANADYKLAGGSPDQYVGHSVSSAGDVDGDGLDDVVVGSYHGPNWSGAAYIVTTR